MCSLASLCHCLAFTAQTSHLTSWKHEFDKIVTTLWLKFLESVEQTSLKIASSRSRMNFMALNICYTFFITSTERLMWQQTTYLGHTCTHSIRALSPPWNNDNDDAFYTTHRFINTGSLRDTPGEQQLSGPLHLHALSKKAARHLAVTADTAISFFTVPQRQNFEDASGRL